jgi:hypothetical protein
MSDISFNKKKSMDYAIIAKKIEARQQATLKAVEDMREYGPRIAFLAVVICTVLSYIMK